MCTMSSQIVQNSKIVVLSSAVDSMNLLMKYKPTQSQIHSSPADGVELFTLKVPYKDQTIGIEFWNIDLENKYKGNAPFYFRDARIAIGFFDMGQYKSFADMKTWIQGFFIHTDYSYNLEVYIVCVRSSFGKEEVSQSELEQYAQRVQAKVFFLTKSKLLLAYRLKPIFQSLFDNIHVYNQRFNINVLNSNITVSSKTATRQQKKANWSQKLKLFFAKLLNFR